MEPEINTTTCEASGMIHEYDEDLSQNPFFKTFLENYLELFSQCVQEKWLICVPRTDSLPKYTFTLEDFTHHILRPINLSQELKSRPSSLVDENSSSGSRSTIPSLSRESSCSNLSLAQAMGFNTTPYSPSNHAKWNFRTLAEINIEYRDKVLLIDTTDGQVDFFNENIPSNNNPRPISVLFDETFYTADKQKYKVLCISSPLNSQMDSDDYYYNNIDERNPSMWNLTSLRDCIDFLWINGKPKTLETFDAYIKLFLHNHRSLEDLPLPVQRDLVYDLYKRCLSCAFKPEPSHKRSRSARGYEKYSVAGTLSSRSNESSISSVHSTSAQNFHLATESYILNGIYRPLIAGITSAVSYEDSVLNKVMRNVADIHPQDLGIKNVHWESLARAKQELSRLSMRPTPLGKLKCLQKTMKYLKHELEELQGSRDEYSGVFSTDELLPIWVYLIVKTPIGNWIAQLQFLRQFRFSALDTPGNESSFFIVTLEASLLYLNSGKISGGLAESERDVGTPYQDYVGEFWLRCLFHPSDGSVLSDMFLAIRHANLEKLEQLMRDYELKKTSDEEQKDSNKEITLCHPLCNCHNCAAFTNPRTEERAESALELRNEDCGLTLLHVASIYGRPKIVDFLLASGAPFEIPDGQGRLPIHYAASRGHQNALLLLLHAGCSIEATDHSLNTPLHLASMNGHEPCVKALIYYAEHSKQSMDVSARNCNGDTALHFASRYGFHGIVQLLVESGASISVTNARQRNPLDVAHDIHVSRILQRSICRRSMIQKSHADFVNVEVVKKGATEGFLMLISDPLPQKTQTVSSDLSEEVVQDQSSISSRRNSTSSVKETSSGTMTRRTSCVITPSFTPTILESEVEEILGRKNGVSRKKREISSELSIEKADAEDMVFHISNVVPESQSEPEHVRKVSVDNLDYTPHVLAQMAHVGVRRRREYQERELRKLFSAIEVGDTPLALFYLGIPNEELENADSIQPGNSSEVRNCHPLCPCPSCAAKSAGLLCKLGLDINVIGPNGLTLLQLAVIYNNHCLVKILLKFGANVDIRSATVGKTALEYAKERYYEDIAVTLQLWKGVSATPATETDVPSN